MTARRGTLDGARVLVVEDEGLIALHIADLIRSWGCVVLGPVPTASAALLLVQTEPPDAAADAAVLDFQLRDGTSAPVAEALRGRDVPYVMLTAVPAELPEDGSAAAVLGKPVNERRLRRALSDALGITS